MKLSTKRCRKHQTKLIERLGLTNWVDAFSSTGLATNWAAGGRDLLRFRIRNAVTNRTTAALECMVKSSPVTSFVGESLYISREGREVNHGLPQR